MGAGVEVWATLNYYSYLGIWCFSTLFKEGWKDHDPSTLPPPPKWISCLFERLDWQSRRLRPLSLPEQVGQWPRWVVQSMSLESGHKTTSEGERGGCLRAHWGAHFPSPHCFLFDLAILGVLGVACYACPLWVAILLSWRIYGRKKRVGLRSWQGTKALNI